MIGFSTDSPTHGFFKSSTEQSGTYASLEVDRREETSPDMVRQVCTLKVLIVYGSIFYISL